MQVEDLLAPAFSCIDDGAESVLQPLIFCQLGQQQHHVADQGAVFSVQFVQTVYVQPRDHQQVDIGLGRDVLEDDNLFVLIYYVGGDVAIADLTKQTI